MKIQKPSIGRIVEYTALDGVRCPAIVSDVLVYDFSKIRIVAFLRESAVDVHAGVIAPEANVRAITAVPFDIDGSNGTWRYPPRCNDEIEV